MKINKKILFGSLLVVFMMLMIPVNSAVESSNINVPTFNTPDEDEMQIDNGLQKPLNDDIKVPDCVEIGDILLVDAGLGWDESDFWIQPGPHNEHAAVYVGNNECIDADSQNGVEKRDYGHYYWRTKNRVFLRVKSANSSQKQNAVNWTLERIGEPYQNINTTWLLKKIANPNCLHPTAKKWYCMELPWAAYYNQGIDIDRNGWGIDMLYVTCVWGDDIIYDDDIEIVYRDVNDSIEFVKPYKGIYIANKKIISTWCKPLIFGKIDVEVKTLNQNITKVDFYIDNVPKASDETEPYIWTWDERDCGEKVIMVVASDDFGNKYYTNNTVRKFL